MIHGGGWGIDTYLNKIAELTANNIALDIVVDGNLEIREIPGSHHNLLTEPFVRILAEQLKLYLA